MFCDQQNNEMWSAFGCMILIILLLLWSQFEKLYYASDVARSRNALLPFLLLFLCHSASSVVPPFYYPLRKAVYTKVDHDFWEIESVKVIVYLNLNVTTHTQANWWFSNSTDFQSMDGLHACLDHESTLNSKPQMVTCVISIITSV